MLFNLKQHRRRVRQLTGCCLAFLLLLYTQPGVIENSLTDYDEHVSRQAMVASSGHPSTVEPDEHIYSSVIKYVGNAQVQLLAREMMKGMFCDRSLGGVFLENRNKTLVNVTFGCAEMYEKGSMGTGNFVAAFYGLRLAAQAVGNVDVLILCNDAEDTKKDLVLPWLTGFFPAKGHSVPLLNRTRPTVEQACTHFNKISLGYIIPSMRRELRRMAIAMVGIPHSNHPSSHFKDEPDQQSGPALALARREDKPIYPNTELDDAVLHFRCGDLIDARHPSFGFMKFQSYSKHVSPDAKSIGIVTQPFDELEGQHRPLERVRHKLDRCRLVVTSFAEHLRTRFPKARVSIRNDKDETIALTFARLVMANQTVIAISSFSVMPAVCTFGTGYIRKPDFRKAPNQFLLHPNVETLVDNVHLVDEPRLMAADVQKMWGENGTAVLNWFQPSSVNGH